jgi:ribosomal protein L37AE/L43A
MLVQSFVCPSCGAPKRMLTEPVVVYCDFCGGMVAYDSTRESSADTAESRQVELDHPARTRQWRAASAAMGELVATDPEAAARYSPVNAASMALGQSSRDPTARARVLLEAWRAYYEWIHSRLGEHAAVIQPEVFARSMVRASIRAMQGLLGEGVVARMREEVLGDTVAHACASCGAQLDGEGIRACAHCGAVVRVETDDPWVAGVLTIWAPNEQRLVREGALDTLEAPLTAIQITMAAATIGSGTVTPEAAHAMLVRLVPWVPKSRLLEAVGILLGAALPATRDTLARVRKSIDATWRMDPSRRPR